MSAWGTKWPVTPPVWPEELKQWPDIKMRELKEYKPVEGEPISDEKLADMTINIIGTVWPIPKEAVRVKNKVPTHDPYANPNAFLYYECKCGKILDPKVKSFAALNNAASEAGWKIRFGNEYYVPYCVECGKDVE